MTQEELTKLKTLLTSLNGEFGTPITVGDVLTLVKDQTPKKVTIEGTSATWVPIQFTDGTRVALPSLVGRNTGLTVDELAELISKGGEIKCVSKVFVATSVEGRRKAVYQWEIKKAAPEPEPEPEPEPVATGNN